MNLLRLSQYIKRFIYVYLMALPGRYRERKLQILREMFRYSIDFMNEVGEEYWLDFGTLLGYYREQDIIPHDIDVDFAMHESAYEKILAKKHLLSVKVKFYDSSHRHHGPKLYFNYKGFDVDVYFYEDLGETMRSYENTNWPNERRAIPKELIYPLKEEFLMDKKTLVPNHVKQYLEYIYGYLGRDAKRNLSTGFWEKK